MYSGMQWVGPWLGIGQESEDMKRVLDGES